ncbi:MAG TPA: hypothetical protein VNB91_01465, partial [Jatrophihabitantaceae bacterium]|nr:hypothetical protein [Jatrophihabitantaceae bacterium]
GNRQARKPNRAVGAADRVEDDEPTGSIPEGAVQLPLIYVDRLIVREGKLAELKTAIRELAEFVAANEPRVIGYDAYFNADETEMTVIYLHPDSYSLAYHRKVAGPLLPPFAQLLEQQSIDVFGEPAAPVLEQLRWKAELLDSGKVRIHAPLRAAAGRAQRSAG